jgi:pilus assembly protein Flp/PilA
VRHRPDHSVVAETHVTVKTWPSKRLAPADAELGASAVEYALIVAAIAAVIVAVVVSLGLVVNKSVTNSCDHIKQTLNNSTEQCVSSP